jgi:hypothetical protein
MHLGKLDALGTCKELEASLGDGGHALNDVTEMCHSLRCQVC